jgi:hypothetical protein
MFCLLSFTGLIVSVCVCAHVCWGSTLLQALQPPGARLLDVQCGLQYLQGFLPGLVRVLADGLPVSQLGTWNLAARLGRRLGCGMSPFSTCNRSHFIPVMPSLCFDMLAQEPQLYLFRGKPFPVSVRMREGTEGTSSWILLLSLSPSGAPGATFRNHSLVLRYE